MDANVDRRQSNDGFGQSRERVIYNSNSNSNSNDDNDDDDDYDNDDGRSSARASRTALYLSGLAPLSSYLQVASHYLAGEAMPRRTLRSLIVSR
jgi:hypothetical protein